MKRLLLAAVAGALILTGCNTNKQENSNDLGGSGLWSGVVGLPDGQRVTCVKLYSDALSCNWGAVK